MIEYVLTKILQEATSQLSGIEMGVIVNYENFCSILRNAMVLLLLPFLSHWQKFHEKLTFSIRKESQQNFSY